ncbi:MAG: hypothetical protein IPJ04_13340 [Candidatus Eisenbacteria bacterium]|nr:hypothetical protein [Candidatus Eisenbacteria bacterium]
MALVTLALVGVIGLAAPAADPALAWGVNAARFLPAGVTLGLLALALAVPLALLVLAPRVPKLPAFAESIVAAAAFAAFAWTFRVSHVLLGDGIPITSSLPDSNALHPREPLSSALLRRAWDVLGPAFAAPGRAREAVVQDVAAVVSVAAGAVFAIAVTGIARELVRAFPSESREGSADDRATTALLTLLIATPGAALVFFGYVEHYAWPAACTALFFWALLRFALGRGGLLAPMFTFLLAVAFHFSSLVLAPALAVAAFFGLASRDRRPAALRDVAIGSVATVAIVAALRRLAGYDALHQIGEIAKSNRTDATYAWSAVHVRDFLDEHLLLGPLGLALALPLLAPFAGDRRAPGAVRATLGVAAVAFLAATWLTPDMPLGYARDWDVFAAAGCGLAIVAAAMLFVLVRAERPRRLLLAAACAVTLAHTLPWIAVNHTNGPAVARFATLPLGLGRTESTLAWWHLQRREYGTARVWIERSLRANPDNIRAVDLYGRVALLEGRPEIAVGAYRIGILMRPERAEYRLQLAFSLHAAGRHAEALAALDTLERTHPDEPALWLERAMSEHALGDDLRARADLVRALQLNPALTATARSVLPTLVEAP